MYFPPELARCRTCEIESRLVKLNQVTGRCQGQHVSGAAHSVAWQSRGGLAGVVSTTFLSCSMGQQSWSAVKLSVRDGRQVAHGAVAFDGWIDRQIDRQTDRQIDR